MIFKRQVSEHLSSILCMSVWFALLLQQPLHAQTITFSENFESDTYPGTTWVGQTDRYLVVTESNRLLLRSNGEAATSNALIAAPSTNAYGTWEFYYRKDDTAPSNTNRAWIFLVADQADFLSPTLNGYALRTGENTTRSFRLVRFSNGNSTDVINTQFEALPNQPYRIKITRELDGTWQVFIGVGNASIPVPVGPPALDNTHQSSNFFGLRVAHSSTQRDKFFFDDIVIKDFIDTITLRSVRVVNSTTLAAGFTESVAENSLSPDKFSLNSFEPVSAIRNADNPLEVFLGFENPFTPGEYTLLANGVESERGDEIPANSSIAFTIENPFRLESFTVVNNQTLHLVFSEAVRAETLVPAHFLVDNSIQPTEIHQTNSTVTLQFASAFLSGERTLSVQNLESVRGWPLPSSISETFFIVADAAKGDVVINEFMYRAPAGEPKWVELRNVSDKYISLAGWRLMDRNTTVRVITNDQRVMAPGAYIVISNDTTTLFNKYGSRSYLHMTNLPSFNTTTADLMRLYTANGAITMDSLEYFPSSWGGNGIALERLSPQAPSIFRANWAESPDPLGGTPGLPNLSAPPDTPPVLEQLTYLDQQRLSLVFNRDLDAASSTQSGNITLSDGLSVSSIMLSGSQSLVVQLTSAMQNGTRYTLQAQGIRDIFQNELLPLSREFDYFDIVPADSGDVVVTEFMFRPPSGFPEYIELYNKSPFAVNVKNWTYANDRAEPRAFTTNDYIIPPNTYFVLSTNTDLLSFFPDVRLIPMGSGFATLKNAADDIVIRSERDILMDSLSYTSSWGGNGVSLERKSVDVRAGFPENWADSPSLELGTPGAPNLVHADIEAPVLQRIVIPSPFSIRLEFSKRIAPETAAQLTNYEVSGGISVTSVDYFANILFLLVNPTLSSNVDYQVRVRNLTDIFGNVMEESTLTERFLQFSNAQPGDVVINEVLFRSSTDLDIPQFIELYNRSNKNLNLTNWFILNNNTTRQLTRVSGERLALEPNTYLVLTTSASFAAQTPRTVQVSQLPTFRTTVGDVVSLRDGVSTIDTLYYEIGWGASLSGTSLERKDPDAPSFDRTNWRTSPEGHTAGRENAAFQPDELPPKVVFATPRTGDSLYVRFDKFVDIPNSSVFFRGAQLDIKRFNPTRAHQVWFDFPVDLAPDIEEAVVFDALVDYKGNLSQNVSLPVARSMDQAESKLVITEIMFNPLTETSTNTRGPQSEYVEFYNPNKVSVSLDGFRMISRSSITTSSSDITPTLNAFRWIPPQSYAVVFADTARLFGNARLVRFFSPTDTTQWFQSNRTSLTLSATNRAVLLLSSNGTVMDSVNYSQNWHNPNMFDTRGIALERLDVLGPSNDPTNWSSSASREGGTPGLRNTNYVAPQLPEQENEIVFTPNPFSPDGDGFEDHLSIGYSLAQADYLLRVRVFDRYGRLVRTLADGSAAGMSGTLYWDGLTDTGGTNRVGIYVVLFEAYNSRHGRAKTIKKAVVLARKF